MPGKMPNKEKSTTLRRINRGLETSQTKLTESRIQFQERVCSVKIQSFLTKVGQVIRTYTLKWNLPWRRSDPRQSCFRTKKTQSQTMVSISKPIQTISIFPTKPQTYFIMHKRLLRWTKLLQHFLPWTKPRFLTTRTTSCPASSKSSPRMRSP